MYIMVFTSVLESHTLAGHPINVHCIGLQVMGRVMQCQPETVLLNYFQLLLDKAYFASKTQNMLSNKQFI